MTRALVLTLGLVSASVAPAAAPAAAPVDIGAAVARCPEIVREGDALRLARTGDRLPLAALASRTLHGVLDDGTRVAVVPFFNAAGAEHSALVFALTATGAREIGGFSATRDHLSISLGGTTDVSFFARPSHGRTLASGGPAPTSRAHIVVRENRLADANAAPLLSVAP